MGRAETLVKTDDFCKSWDGKALVAADKLPAAPGPDDEGLFLDPNALKLAKGGSPVMTGGAVTPPPCSPPGGGGGGSSVGSGSDPCDSSDTHSNSMLPGTSGSPTARTGVAAPGVHHVIDVLQTALHLSETDVSVGIRGPMTLSFDRTFMNEKGIPRTEFTDATKTWSNNVGKGWTHSLNMHLKTTSEAPPTTVTFYDESGTPRDYTFSSTSGGYNWYYRGTYGTSGEKANVLKRNTTTLRYTLELISGLTYEFSAATTDTNRYARLETIKDLSGNQITLAYDGAVGTGRLTKATPPSGDARYLQLSYAGSLITKVDLRTSSQVLNTASFAYSGNELTKVTDAANQTVQYTYGTNSNRSDSRYITSITDKKGIGTTFAWTFTANSGGVYEANKIDLTNADGLKTTYDRSISSGVCVITNWDGSTNLSKEVNTPVTGDPGLTSTLDYYTGPSTYERWTYEYDANKNMTRVLRPGGVVHLQYAYTTQGRLSTAQIGTSGPITTCEYAAGNSYATKITDGTGLSTYYDYDASKRITKVRPPYAASAGFTYSYDPYGQVTASSNPLGQTTTYAFDTVGNNTAVTDPTSVTQTMGYDDLGNVTQVTDARSKTWYYDYAYGSCGGCGNSGGGLVTKLRDPLSQQTTLAYDNNGNMTLITDAMSHTAAYSYDAMNRLTKVESPASSGTQATLAYNKLGQITSQTGFDGRSVSLAYDHIGRATSATDAVGTVSAYYDSAGNLSTVTDSLSQSTVYTYTADNLLTKITYANGKMVVYGYDGAYRMTKMGAGSTGTIDPTEYAFSSTTGMISKVRYISGGTTYDAFYNYDGKGHLTQLTDWLDATNGLRYAYDAAGRLTQLTDYDNAALTYAYDAAGDVTSMTDYHGNSTTYTYTDTGQLSTLTAPGSRTWDYDYNALDQPTQVTLPNGMYTTYGYDSRNRLTQIHHHTDASTTALRFDYGLDAGGNITHVNQYEQSASVTGQWDYGYDGRNRLTKAERSDGGATLLTRWTYTYSAGDNLTTKEVYTPPSTTETTAFAYNTDNELTSQTVGGVPTNFTYDAWGRMTAKVQGTYSASFYYGQGDKLTGITSDFPGEGNVTYSYGGDAKRRQRNDGTITQYRWDDGWTVLNEEDGGGVLSLTLVGGLAAISGNNPAIGTIRNTLSDQLGSSRALYASNKALLGTNEYTPYGEDYFQFGAIGTRKFTGYDWEGTANLYFAPYRYYIPNFARWLTRDPEGIMDGLNLYQYVNDNPVMAIDVLGLSGLGKIVKLTLKGLKTTATCVSKEKLIKAVKEGEDVSGSRALMREVFTEAGDGSAPVFHKAHGGGKGADAKFYDHYHLGPEYHGGAHGFIQGFAPFTAPLTVAYYAKGHGALPEVAAEVIDFFNPLSLPQDIVDIADEITGFCGGLFE
jgi:RHS repeat-associated protein